MNHYKIECRFLFQIHAIILIAFSIIIPALTEIPSRYRPRGPPLPPRPPLPPQFKGKWPPPMPGRGTNRPNFPVRPIPVQMGHASYKQQVVLPRPQRFPVQQQAPINFPSAIWKTPANIYRPPVEKPFMSFPVINKPYEYVNTEAPLQVSAPLIPNTIKQIGEKGPIHTIPAPKLSPADKPANFKEDIPPKSTYNFKEHDQSPNSIPQAQPLVQYHSHQNHLAFQQIPHQYQVNEFNSDPHNGHHHFYAPDPDQKQNFNHLNADLASLASVVPQATSFGQPQQAILASQHNIVSPPVPGVLSAQELVQIINSIPQNSLVDSYGTPLANQPQLQQHFMQLQSTPVAQISVQGNNQQLYQPEYNQIQDVPQSVKDNFKPQFHTFNYVEQGRPNDFAQSRNTDYESQSSENVAVKTNSDAIAQSQYVQQYFVNNEENVNENNVEVEDPSEKEAKRILSQLTTKGEVGPNLFYSSLPNREAAETLATLQAAGNVNSNLMKNIQHEQNTMRIYVPDDEEPEEMETSEEKSSSSSSNRDIKIYETYNQNRPHETHKSSGSIEYDSGEYHDVDSKEFNVQDQLSFGSRIKSRKEI